MLRVIISLTTIPSRIKNITTTILNICEDQTVKPNILHLYVPKKLHRTDEESLIPNELIELQKKYDFFKISLVDDLGPITKVYYAFKEYTNQTDIIISIDDDILYDSHMIEEFMDGHKINNNDVLVFMGTKKEFDKFPFVHAEYIQQLNTSRQFLEVDGIGGYRGVLFPRKCIDNLFFTLFNNLNSMHIRELNCNLLEDDLYISLYLKKKNIKITLIGTYYKKKYDSYIIDEIINIAFLDVGKLNNLYSENNSENMGKSSYLINYFFNF